MLAKLLLRLFGLRRLLLLFRIVLLLLLRLGACVSASGVDVAGLAQLPLVLVLKRL